jgi:hypothetical protein
MKFNKLQQLLEDTNKETIAILPGAFKPPGKHHLYLAQKLLEKSDKLYIIISSPKSDKSKRYIGDKEVTPEISKKIWEKYVDVYGISDNVDITISEHPSPIRAAYEFAEKELKNVNILFGASDKDGDWKRWADAPKYFAEKSENKTLNILDPEENAIEALTTVDGESASATEIRNSWDDLEKLQKLLPEKLTRADLEEIQRMI